MRLLLRPWPGPGWYLDAVASSWDRMYVLDPMTNISEDKAPLLLGGEGAMWGEHVDPSDLELTVWPRLAAIAERLWSAREVNSTAEALPRLQVFRCRLLERGVRSGVVGGEARSLPPGPGSCSQVIQPKAGRGIRFSMALGQLLEGESLDFRWLFMVLRA